MSTWAVVVAAGSGERLAQAVPKAFASLGGRPLLAESVERLDASDWIDALVLVVPEGWEEPAILLAEELGTGKVAQVVCGGETRAESVRLGVAEVPQDAVALVVHDAARPLVSEAVLERVLTALGEGWDGAVPGVPLADTIKRVEGEAVVETIPRNDLVAVQTPQAFAADVLRAALAGDIAGATDCASLVERVGGRVKVTEGDPQLLKITSAGDLALAERFLAESASA